MSYNFDDKPKNDFSDNYGKPKNDYQYSPPERGGCLSLFLGFIMVVNVLAILFICVMTGQISSSAYGNSGLVMIIFGLSILAGIAQIACAYGLWNWKSWGYNGLIFLYIVSIVINLIGNSLPSAGGSVIGLAILYYLMQDKKDYLE